jgi:tetratricopeptide (TPR) repeat protein
LSDSIETVDQLRAQLDAAVDEGEQAGLQQSLEALAYSARALAIRARLADADIHAEPLFGVSLFNRGGHLSALDRFDEAVSYYATAHRVFGRHLTDPLTLGRFATNAAQLSSALGQLGAYDMAARFQGAAVVALLEASGPGDRTVPRRRTVIATDAVTPDGAAAV